MQEDEEAEKLTRMVREIVEAIADDPVARRKLIRAIANDTPEAAYLGRRIEQAKRAYAASKEE